ncbi:MAG: rod shape-determining protein MreC [Treponema sp.]|nr:rod shape-determining protein MreC [Treponema sp.]
MRIGRRRKPKKRISMDTFVFAVLALSSFILLFFSAQSFVVNIKDVGLSVFSGVRGGLYGVSSFIGRTVLSIRELAALRREYAELTGQIAKYEQLGRNAAEILQENNRLREQLGFAETLQYRYIPAEIIGRDPDNLFSALVINKGKRHGVRYNMPLIAYQNGLQALAGKVVLAGQFESLIIPLYDMSSIVPARLAAARFDGLVEGQGKREAPLRMRLISKRARNAIHYGDMIITSGIKGVVDAVYPGGINIGRVSAVFYQENETSMEVELESAIDFSRLEYLFVIDASSAPPAEWLDAADTGMEQEEAAGNE